MLCTLKGLSLLDGQRVAAEDKRSAEEAYLSQVVEFNDHIEAMTQDHQREMDVRVLCMCV
jgi:hypothetical protein